MDVVGIVASVATVGGVVVVGGATSEMLKKLQVFTLYFSDIYIINILMTRANHD